MAKKVFSGSTNSEINSLPKIKSIKIRNKNR